MNSPGALSVLIAACFLVLALPAAEAKPAHAMQMDAVDACLFSCDACYKGEALLLCANTCLQMDGLMGSEWQQTCPYFRKKPLFLDFLRAAPYGV